MKKTILFLCVAAFALSACQKSGDSAQSAAPATPAAPAAEPVKTGSSDSGLPQECKDYEAKVTACVNKIGASGSGAAVKQGFEAAKAQWATITDKSALAGACKAANDGFQQSASAMGC